MTLQPNFLPVGSVVEYNIGRCDDEYYKPIVITESEIKECCELNEIFNQYYRPIKLTPEILTEWCGAEFNHKVRKNNFYSLGDFYVMFDGKKIYFYANHISVHFCELTYLHELQLLFLGMKQVLPITIK